MKISEIIFGFNDSTCLALKVATPIERDSKFRRYFYSFRPMRAKKKSFENKLIACCLKGWSSKPTPREVWGGCKQTQTARQIG